MEKYKRLIYKSSYNSFSTQELIPYINELRIVITINNPSQYYYTSICFKTHEEFDLFYNQYKNENNKYTEYKEPDVYIIKPDIFKIDIEKNIDNMSREELIKYIKNGSTFLHEPNNDYYLIGKYLVEGRRKGTDCIARPEISLIFDQINRLILRNSNKDIVLEGDRVASDVLLSKIAESGLQCKLYWIQCSTETSIRRCTEAGDSFKDSNLKAVCTKAKNRYDKWSDSFNGEIINTDSDIDFTNLKINL